MRSILPDLSREKISQNVKKLKIKNKINLAYIIIIIDFPLSIIIRALSFLVTPIVSSKAHPLPPTPYYTLLPTPSRHTSIPSILSCNKSTW